MAHGGVAYGHVYNFLILLLDLTASSRVDQVLTDD